MQFVLAILIIGILSIGWLISTVQDSVATSQKNKKKLDDVKDKWKGRTFDKSKTLGERNGDIILKHIGRLRGGYQRSYYVENCVRDCIQDITEAEGNLAMSPNYSYLSTWQLKATPEYLELSKTLERLFKDKWQKLTKDQEFKRVTEVKEQVSSLKDKFPELIEQFYEVAERKVSLVDDYGDENWAVLPKEIDVVISKIAGKDGHSEEEIKRWKKWGMPEEYRELATELNSSFKNFHTKELSRPKASVDVSEMRGVDFESHLMSLLREKGFTNIRGTPTTGDQGADLLAKKDGKNIVIQAKRYTGSVGNKAVQEVASAVSFYGGDEGWVITNSTFTKSAKELAQRTGVRLIDWRNLSNLS